MMIVSQLVGIDNNLLFFFFLKADGQRTEPWSTEYLDENRIC